MKCVVFGAGTMGCGIAEVLLRSGAHVQLIDRSSELVEAGVGRLRASLHRGVSKGKLTAEEAAACLSRVKSDSLEVSEAELVIEAVVEDLAVKKELLAPLSVRFPAALLASNTSSLSLTEIAAACARPERVIGLHFFNPPPIMELLEVVTAEQTGPATLERALELARSWGKTPIVVKDTPGFASSRLGIILGMEAIRMLESGVAGARDIDRAMELGYRHPMGPLKLTDLVGLDVRLAIAEHLTREIGPQFTPPPLLRRLVRAGRLGKKTGQGFYRWEGNDSYE
ncbi:MAG: 3-hydroxyacyl-CoA dehydrogenase family protein [Candidatus Eremiobacteraeota bacterium]|nr:3-hydroxyacyl-CoA dehydrogenase family protein [Candidatus Eremiobacteraeota bacterium]MCW5865940.1 3-hydroxyacyl-CoA dehydrogenase family protein [Candidatus Eremiobacteraeota bacterium]